MRQNLLRVHRLASAVRQAGLDALQQVSSVVNQAERRPCATGERERLVRTGKRWWHWVNMSGVHAQSSCHLKCVKKKRLGLSILYRLKGIIISEPLDCLVTAEAAECAKGKPQKLLSFNANLMSLKKNGTFFFFFILLHLPLRHELYAVMMHINVQKLGRTRLRTTKGGS